MKLFAHRGDWELFPENSQTAIESSINSGFDVETDIRFTADKKIILVHDLNLSRLFNVNNDVSDINYEQIKDLTFVSDKSHHLLLFDQLAPEITKTQRNFAIHFKQDDQNEENCIIIADLFKKYQLYSNCFLFNLSLETCQIFRKIDPQIRLSVLISDQKFEPFVYLYEEVHDHLDLFDIFWAAEYKDFYSEDLIVKAHQLNKEIIAVSLELHKSLGHQKALDRYIEYWPKLLSWGIDGICTDYPLEFTEIMQKVSK